ncbi:hypothetical protein BJX65DRAFT_314065 [Aspergillus insuetus]
MKYPFKAETLCSIRDNIAEARLNLGLVIQLPQIDKFLETTEKIDLIIRWQQDKETREIMEWLSPTNFWLKQADVMKQRQPGAAEWLLKDPDFLEWETGVKRTFFRVEEAVTGVGKKVLSSVVVDFLETDLPASDISFAFVYCDYTLSQAQSVEYFLRAIARQIVELRHSIPASVLELYQRHRGKRTAATEDEYSKLLESLSQDSTETYVIVDALDECINSQGGLFWTELLRRLTSSIANPRLLCASRRIEDPSKIFESAIRVEIRASQDDIVTYITKRIASNDTLSAFCDRDLKLRQDIVDEIASKTDGMFLIAHLYIESLSTQSNPRALKRALKQMPEQLDDLYTEAMQRLTSLPTAKLALRHAVAIDELEPKDDFIPEDCITDETTIINACVGLVRGNEEDHTISLVHYTTREFFDHNGSESISSAKPDIAPGHALSDLGHYIWWNLCHHLQDAMESTSTGKNKKLEQCSIKLFLDSPRMSFLSGLPIRKAWATSKGTPWTGLAPSFQGIHYASYFGLLWIMPPLIQAYGVDYPSQDQGRQSSLLYAAERGKIDAVRLLLEHGAQVNYTDNGGHTALNYATTAGHL